MGKIKKWILAAAFLVILGTVILVNNRILEQKYSKDVMAGFYDLPEDSLDVVFAGSSHMLNGVLPLNLWKDFGIRAYNIGQHGQRLNMTYYYIKEAIEKQAPQAVVVDLYYAMEAQTNNDIANLHKSIDNLALGKNKLAAIKNAVPSEYWWEVFYNAYLYHSRWDELEEEDFTYLTKDPLSVTGGTEMRWGNVEFEQPHVIESGTTAVLEEDTIYWLNQIIELGKDTDTTIIFTVLPYIASDEAQAKYNEAGRLIEQAGGNFVNFMYLVDEIGLECSTDMYDSEHLNPYGAKKVTEYLGWYLSSVQGFPDQRENHDVDREYWDRLLLLFERKYKAGEISNMYAVDDFLSAIQDENYIVAIAIWPDQSLPGENILNSFRQMGINIDGLAQRSNQYAALIDMGEGVLVDQTENSSMLRVTKEAGGVSWQLTSQAGQTSIMVDLQEKAVNKSSMNIVVYDKILGDVIDSVSISDLQEMTRE